MSKIRRTAWVCTISALGLAAGTAFLGAGRNEQVTILQTGARNYIVPAAQIISFNDTVGRLDTTTGAVHQLSGDLRNPSVRNEWELRVPAVSGETSGFLEIQRATFNDPEAIFLVDIVTGKTWLLRRRGNDNGTWDPVTFDPRG
jgi:hypothetical protein